MFSVTVNYTNMYVIKLVFPINQDIKLFMVVIVGTIYFFVGSLFSYLINTQFFNKQMLKGFAGPV